MTSRVSNADLNEFLHELAVLGIAETLPSPAADPPLRASVMVRLIEGRIRDKCGGRVDPREAVLVLVALVGVNTVRRGDRLDRGFPPALVRALARFVRLVPDRFRDLGIIPSAAPNLSTVGEAMEEGGRRHEAYTAWWTRAWAGCGREGWPYAPVLGGAFDTAPRTSILEALRSAASKLKDRGVHCDDLREILNECLAEEMLMGAVVVCADGLLGLDAYALRDALDLARHRALEAPSVQPVKRTLRDGTKVSVGDDLPDGAVDRGCRSKPPVSLDEPASSGEGTLADTKGPAADAEDPAEGVEAVELKRACDRLREQGCGAAAEAAVAKRLDGVPLMVAARNRGVSPKAARTALARFDERAKKALVGFK